MKLLASTSLISVCGIALFAAPANAQTKTKPPTTYPALPSEIPAKFKPKTETFDYSRRQVMIPMRDGVKLHTVILVPKRAKGAPMLLTRTPYSADRLTSHAESAHLGPVLNGYDNALDVILEGGYIRVVQDVRGKHGSEGDYIVNRPLRGPLNPTPVDHATDTYDTIDWLVKHVPESNGKVGILGISYDGFLPLMALVDPHPALKVSVPMNPMVDGWRGDDWFHYGAFRQINVSWIYNQVATRKGDAKWWRSHNDEYDMWMQAVSAGELGRRRGMDQLGFWNKLVQHPAYDDFWREQAVDKLLGRRPLKTPVMLVHSLWDQEDIYGALAPVTAFETGTNEWRRYSAWPPDEGRGAGGQRRAGKLRPLYLRAGLKLSCHAPKTGEAPFEEYVSDPAKPVPFVRRPIKAMGYEEDNVWPRWLVDDQRDASGRPDVVTFISDVLTAPLKILGEPVANLVASTSGTDSDWVVKLIDVYPDEVGGDAVMGGYQLMIAADIFRGRYRESFAKARPIAADMPLLYRFALPTANHVFLPGHRLMVQIQSSWFPLYDRNPQTFVPNIFWAKPDDYRKATQRVYHAPENSSFIELPIAAAETAARPLGKNVRVLVWDEQQVEQRQAYGARHLGGTIAAYLEKQPGLSVTSVSLSSPNQGLADEVLDATDVLVMWSHLKQHELKDARAEAVVKRVLDGKLGLVALHSAHWAKPFVRLMQERAKADALAQLPEAERANVRWQYLNDRPIGKAVKPNQRLTPFLEIGDDGVRRLTLPQCVFPFWRADGKPSRVTTLLKDHPLARGLPATWQIPRTEMYGGAFHVPRPDDEVFEETWTTGERFRSGSVWKVGNGRVVYFRPGHETYAVYKEPEPLRVVENAVRWLGAARRE